MEEYDDSVRRLLRRTQEEHSDAEVDGGCCVQVEGRDALIDRSDHLRPVVKPIGKPRVVVSLDLHHPGKQQRVHTRSNRADDHLHDFAHPETVGQGPALRRYSSPETWVSGWLRIPLTPLNVPRRPDDHDYTAKAPTELSKRSQTPWRAALDVYDLHAAELELLRCALVSLDRADEAGAAIARDGVTVVDRYGSPNSHLAADIETRNRAALARMVAQLVDDETKAPHPKSIRARNAGDVR